MAADQVVVVRPTDLVFSAVENGSCGASQGVAITSISGWSVPWQITTSESWLQVSATTGFTSTEVTASADCTGLTAGVYQATLTVNDQEASGSPVVVTAKLIVNPASRVALSTWKDGSRGAFSVSTDDGHQSGFTELLSHGLTGTFVMNGTEPPPFYGAMFEEGMELGSHLVSHHCQAVDEPTLRYEIEANMAGVAMATQSNDEVISLIWPCGFTNLEYQAIAAEYFLSARGYNINELEEATPANLMNLKSFNSHEHTPFPPEDLKSIVDAAEASGKWANLVLHAYTNDDAAISYSLGKDVWVAPIGSVIKYILQRDRTVISQYAETASTISFSFHRLPIASTVRRDFEATIRSSDEITFRVDVTTIPHVSQVTVSGFEVPFHVKPEGGSKFLYFSSRVTPGSRTAEISVSETVPPILELVHAGLAFTANEGQEVSGRSIVVANAGSGIFDWTATVEGSGPEWLALNPAYGISPGVIGVNASLAGLTEGTYHRIVTIDAPAANNSPLSVMATLTVNPAGALSYDMSYPNRASLLADGWNFLAQTGSGATRNTEHTDLTAVVYNSLGGLRVPADVGDLWAGLNNTRNSVFRNLPTNWTSVRVRLDFAPTLGYQQAGLVVYDNDDNYVQVTRDFVNAHHISFVREAGASATVVASNFVNATTDLVLRLDRDLATNVITGKYSVDSGATWQTLGSIGHTFGNPRLGLITGALDPGSRVLELGAPGYSEATYRAVHVVTGDMPPPPPPPPTGTTSLSYSDRASLLADGWDFQARSANGNHRPTEQSTGATVGYSATGPLRIPADVGDLWEGLNNTRNSLFRDLPASWTSVRVRLDFAPTQNYQQAGLVVYQNDDNYVQVTRDFNEGQHIAFVREVGGSASVLSLASVSAITNMVLRLDRNVVTNVITGLYSLDGGTTWQTLGSVTQNISSPRLGLIVTASPGGFPEASLHYVQVLADSVPATPALALSSTNLSFVAAVGESPHASQTVYVSNIGAGSLNWTATIGGSGTNWLGIGPASGTGDRAIQVNANAAGLPVGTYTRTINVAASGADNSPQTVNVTLIVTPAAPGNSSSYQMNYADSASLHADGWDFLARTAVGGFRNTQQLNGAVVIYNPSGPLQVPADAGDLWEGLNDTRNSLFRDLPLNWTSARVQLDFAPTQNYQQAGLVVYQDDDTYVQMTRVFNNGQRMTMVREAGGVASVPGTVPVSATTNMVLRLDRQILTNEITGLYSVDGGVTWQTLGSVVQAIGSPRLGLIIGASPSGVPQAAFHVVDVYTDETPTLTLSTSQLNLQVNENEAIPVQPITITTSGSGATIWTATVESASGPNWLSAYPLAGSGSTTLDISIDTVGLAPGSHTRSITIEAAGAVNSPQTLNVTVVITQAGTTAHYVLDYPNRASLIAGGWDFLARTSGGAARNTEQSGSQAVGYNSSGGILVPAESGDLWEGANDTRNSLFRDLPASWTSVSALLDFAPTQNYQEAGMVVYDNDDHYVQITRVFNGGQRITLVRETGGVAFEPGTAAVSATTNILLRLDRNLVTNVITGLYSLDGGTIWHALGSVAQAFGSPRLGLIVGASPGGLPAAILRRVEVSTQ